ncbi:hypothetical protein ABIC08_006254 [Bradyrhizobium sp. RT9b]
MARSKRWSMKVPAEKVAPAGPPGALAEAKRELGTFDLQHKADEVCLCESCAERRIVELAARFNKLRIASKGAPRAGHVTRNLEEISMRFRQLAVTLSSLDDYSRDWLRRPRAPAAGGPDPRLLFKTAGAAQLPPPSLIADGDGEIVAQLRALSEYARIMAQEFEIWSLLNTPFPIKDRGGNTNMLTQWYGVPAERLVIGAYHIYDDFRPGEARKTEDGSFHTFVNQVFVFATGTRKGQSSLIGQIKRLLGRDGALKIPK